MGGGRNFERPIFRNLKIPNVKEFREVQLFDFFIYEIIFSFFFQLLEHSKFGFFSILTLQFFIIL